MCNNVLVPARSTVHHSLLSVFFIRAIFLRVYLIQRVFIALLCTFMGINLIERTIGN